MRWVNKDLRCMLGRHEWTGWFEATVFSMKDGIICKSRFCRRVFCDAEERVQITIPKLPPSQIFE